MRQNATCAVIGLAQRCSVDTEARLGCPERILMASGLLRMVDAAPSEGATEYAGWTLIIALVYCWLGAVVSSATFLVPWSTLVGHLSLPWCVRSSRI